MVRPPIARMVNPMRSPAAPLRVLTPEQEKAVRLAISRGATDAEAGRVAGISARKFYAARLAELSDIPRHKRGPRQDRTYEEPKEILDMPIDEIYRRAAMIRAARTSDRELDPDRAPGRHRGAAGEGRPAVPDPGVDDLEEIHYRRLHHHQELEDVEQYWGR